ncbi:factor-independent urate hydroxylase [Plastoroseomonas arctica]|uniref:Uricase n=1 Tax=Plastoroseomonas arctica TaxID=1509237 RepID=A0AAF1KR50_9PROT|nr:urate oxidase [Plastoroseomonas arctica]MBR0653907.1 urate oxidase [Plastoroseomonas arctica]
MALINSTYGKGRVRIMRVKRDTARHEVRELSVKTLLTGGFDRVFTDADNSAALCTDTVKNITWIVARENVGLDSELYGKALAQKFLDAYPQVETVTVISEETKWTRMVVDGEEQDHGFILDANGKPTVTVEATRAGMAVTSGLSGFTFMKSTESGWDKFFKDEYTTLAETRDRIAATAMEARWRWSRDPADYAAANALILKTMLKVFVSTYSESVQDSLYRMGMAALDAVPELIDIHMACPNKHYVPINLKPFGMDYDNMVLLPTDEPHGQIECTVGRD